MKLGVIVNTTARGRGAARSVHRAIAVLRERADSIDLHSGDVREDAIAALQRMRDGQPDTIVVIGGDGTVGLAANLLAGSGVPLAVVPAGTGNDFAAAHGIPRDADAAAHAVFDGETVAVDLAAVTTHDGSTTHVATVLAAGFDSKVNDRANRMSWPRGRARYNVAIAVEFALLKPLPFQASWVDAAGTEHARGDPLLLAAVGTTSSYGGGIPICVGADPSDGLLDLTIVRPAGRLKLVRVLASAFKGRHDRHPQVEMHRGREVTLSSPDLTAYADGDALGALPVRIRVAPGALLLRRPRA